MKKGKLFRIDFSVSVPYRGATFLNFQEEKTMLKSTIILFPSPIGELHFSIVDTPLYNTAWLVSVPYRGATFLNIRDNGTKNLRARFPSPIGELHFSIGTYRRKVNQTRFPSPIGELHFSIAKQVTFRAKA